MIKLLNQEFGDNTKLRSAHIKAIWDAQPLSNAHNLKQLGSGYEGCYVLCICADSVLCQPMAFIGSAGHH